MLSKQRIRSLPSLVLVCVLLFLSILPGYAQSDSSTPSADSTKRVFIPFIATDGPQDAIDAEAVAADEVDAAATTDFSAAPRAINKALTAVAPDAAADASVDEVSAAAADAVCLISGFYGNIRPYANAYAGAYSTTQCKYIDVQLDGVSNVVWVRVQYYKGSKIKYGKWYYINTTAVYRILKNPKAGSVFYLEFYNPLSFTSYVQGAVRY